MDNRDFIVGVRRRKIEDGIIEKFYKVNFKQKRHRYLEDEVFWDYIFAWYDLVKYYEDSEDTAIGQNMLQLYAECVELFQQAAQDRKLRERRRDKGANAVYQLNFYLNQVMLHVQRNVDRSGEDDIAGKVNW